MSIWQKGVQWGFVGLFTLVPLIWLPNTSELFEFPKMLATYLFTTAIVGAWAARCISEKKIIFKRTALDIPLLVFLGFSILSLIFSIDTHVSWYGYYSRFNGGLLSLLSYSLLYWAFVSNMTREAIPKLINWSLITAGTIATYGALEHFGVSPSCLLTRGQWGVDCWVQDVQTRVFATLGQPNWMAAYIASLIFIPLSNLLKFQITNSKSQINSKFSILNLVFFILLFAALLFTKSRSGLLAFGISAIVFWGVLLKDGPLRLVLKGVSLFILLTAVLTLLIPNPVRDLVIKSSTPAPVGPALETGGTESGNIRKIVWTGAIRIWQGSTKNFLLGTGPETFAEAYYQYRPLEHNQTSEWELLYNKAHNEFLNYLATTGLLGLLSYLVLLGFMLKALFNNSPSEGALQTALLAGWVSLIVTNFWGFSVVIGQIFLFLFPAMAIALEVQSDKGTQVQSKSSRGQIFALLLCTLVTLYLSYSTLRYFFADVRFATAQNLIRSFQATSEAQYLIPAYNTFTVASRLNRREPAILAEAAVAAAYIANALRDTEATAAAQLAQLAVTQSQLAIAISPHHPNYYKSAARALILLSDIDPRYLDSAAAALAKAAVISPTDPRIPYNLGVVYKYQGATDSARLALQTALNLKPDFPDPAKQLEELQP